MAETAAGQGASNFVIDATRICYHCHPLLSVPLTSSTAIECPRTKGDPFQQGVEKKGGGGLKGTIYQSHSFIQSHSKLALALSINVFPSLSLSLLSVSPLFLLHLKEKWRRKRKVNSGRLFFVGYLVCNCQSQLSVPPSPRSLGNIHENLHEGVLHHGSLGSRKETALPLFLYDLCAFGKIFFK